MKIIKKNEILEAFESTSALIGGDIDSFFITGKILSPESEEKMKKHFFHGWAMSDPILDI